MILNFNLFLFRKRLQPVSPLTKIRFRAAWSYRGPSLSTAVLSTFLFLFLLSFSIPTYAQTPQYSTTQGASNNVFPFGSTSSNKVQWLYVPSDFTTTIPSGNITKLYFRTWNGTYSATYTNFTIKMGMTTMSAFSSTTYVTGLTPVYGPTTHTVSSTGPYTWFAVTLSNPFPYNSGSNLIIEIEQSAMTGSITANCQAPANRRIWGSFGSSVGTNYGSTMGDLGLDVVNPCVGPSSPPSASNITSNSAILSWGAVTPSTGYNYVLSTTATPPVSNFTNTNNTSFAATGLTPATTYHFYVRNNCSTNAWSQWAYYSFTTNPPCSKRSIKVKNITTNSADIRWNKETYSSEYEWVLKTDSTTPSSGTLVNDSAYNAKSLAEGTTYYFFVRMRCPGGEVSEWAMEPFTTRTICRPPQLKVDHLEADRAVVYWDAVKTAIQYEYEVSQSPTPLGKGTKIKQNTFLAFPLKDGQQYYFHVKSICNDQGFVSESEWTSTAWTTFPSAISNTPGKNVAVALYPNPLKDMVTLDITGKDVNDAHVTITDISGRIVYTSIINSNKTTIDLGTLSAGIYLMRYADNDYSSVIRLTKE